MPGQRSHLNLENFHEIVGDIKLQTLSSYKARFLTALLNRYVKESIAMASKMDCKCVGNEVSVAA